MKNFMSIRKLYEDFDPATSGTEMQGQEPMQMAPPAPIQPMDQMGQMEEPIEPMDDQEPQSQMNEPTQKALPEFDPMNLTVAQFIERCDKINPLVCMGLSSFIESNKDALANEVNGGEEFNLDQDANLDFPPAEGQHQHPDFSLDQPASDLNFPQAQNQPMDL